VHAFTEHCKKQKLRTENELAGIRSLMDTLYNRVRKEVFRRKNYLESGIMNDLIDVAFEKGETQGIIGTALEELVGEAWMEDFVGGMVTDWVEALDGILRVKYK